MLLVGINTMSRLILIIVVISFLLSCSLFEEKAVKPNQVEKIDSTWAKNIIGGKSFFISLGNKPDSVKNGLEILLKPVSFENKIYSISFIYHKKPFIDYFEARKKNDPTLDVIAAAIGISLVDNNVEQGFLGSVEINNKKPNFPVAALIITNVPETFTYEDFKLLYPSQIQGNYKKEYSLHSSQKLIIRFQRFERQYFDNQTLIFNPLDQVK